MATAVTRHRRSRWRSPIAVAVLLLAIAACADERSGTATERTTTTIETPARAANDRPEPTVVSDVAYGEDPRRQILDVHVPAGDGPFPTILAIHGGRFSMGGKTLYNQHANYFTERGVAFVPTNYRLAPTDTWPAQVEDVHCALAWIHAHADEYGFDPTRIFVLGGSAGGYLAAMLGTVNDPNPYLTGCPHQLPADRVAGTVVFYGFFDFIDLDDYPPVNIGIFENLWGAEHDELSGERLGEMSPVALVDGSESPFLLIHGTEDTIIPAVMSERFASVLERFGVDTDLLLVDAGHAFETQPTDVPVNVESLAAIERFIDESR